MKKHFLFLFLFLCLMITCVRAEKVTVTYSNGAFDQTITDLDETVMDTLIILSASPTDYLTLADLRLISQDAGLKTKGNGTLSIDLTGAAFENGIFPGPGSGNNGAFDQFYPLKEVILPQGIKQIGRVAFRYCRYMEKINLPDGLEVIGGNAFALQSAGQGALVLTSLPNTVKTIGSYAFYNHAKLGLLSLPDSLRGTIDAQTFGGANVAISEIPEGVSIIGSNAFNCGAVAVRQNINAITFPSTLNETTGITAGAFTNQVNIKKIRFKTSFLPFATGDRPFGSTTASMSDVTIWVPKGARMVYMSEQGEGKAFEGMSIKEAGTVVYDANTGSGDAPVEGEKIVGESFTAAANTFTKDGYRFTAWNTQADGLGIAYAVGASITPVAEAEAGEDGIEDTESITLYAQWESTVAPDLTVSEDLTIFADATYGNITVNAGKELTVDTGVTLVADAITLKSNESGTATVLGNTIATTSNVEQYLPVDAGRQWFYLASPVTGASSILFGENKVSHYDETTHTWALPYASETNLTAGRGYAVTIDAPAINSVYTFTGILNNGTISVPVTHTSGNEKSGFNLIGNPYPSYLDWDAVGKDNVQSTIWMRTYEDSEMIFETYNADAQIGSDGQTNAHIAPLQAFWVRVPVAKEGASDLSVEFTDAQRLHKSDGDANLRSIQQRPMARFQVSNGTNSDRAVILFDDRATNGFDRYDSEKMSNDNAAIPEIYTLSDNEQLVINTVTGIAEDREFSLGFRTGTAGIFSISASTLENLENITLIDHAENVEFDLANGSVYEFASDVTDNTDRFSVAFRAPQQQTGNAAYKAKKTKWFAFAKNGSIVVQSSEYNNQTVSVFNVAGQKLVEESIKSTFHILHAKFPKGVFCVKVNGETVKVAVK